jgi:hypothetical protein
MYNKDFKKKKFILIPNRQFLKCDKSFQMFTMTPARVKIFFFQEIYDDGFQNIRLFE